MPLNLPNLDDRTYADLVEEARGLMVAYAPELTNHNPSDPAVTLVELFAYITEVLLFRLNYVTDANRAAFLRLLKGDPQLRAPATREELDADIREAVLALRRTDRAVTPADFELLARAADPRARVARAQCIPERNLSIGDPALRRQVYPGHVSVVIVQDEGADLDELIALVAAYLEPRRLLTTRVHVVGPRYIPLRVRLTLRLLPDALEDDVRARAVEALSRYLHPLTGRDGDGWPFGRNVYISEIYRLLDMLPGVDFVRRTIDDDTGLALDELVTTSAYLDRLVRNEGGELISLALEPDELVESLIAGSDIAIELSPQIA